MDTGSPEIELYLIRHGESQMNAEFAHLIGGRSNETPLTPKGVWQAQLLGGYLGMIGLMPDKVFVSPAVRTLETARLVLNEMDVEIEPIIDDELQEMEQGEWVGQVRDDILTAEVLAHANEIGKAFKGPGGESMDDVGLRKYTWLVNTFAETVGQDRPLRVFVFGHGMAIKCLFSYFLDMSRQETYDSVTPNTSMSLIVRTAGKWTPKYLGLTPHLDE